MNHLEDKINKMEAELAALREELKSKPQYKVGSYCYWKKHLTNYSVHEGCLAKVYEIAGDILRVDWIGKTGQMRGGYGIENFVLITNEDDIKKYLIQSAKEHGLVLGVKFNNNKVLGRNESIEPTIKGDYVMSNGDLLCYTDRGNNWTLYKNGIWAEVAKDELKIGEYKVEFGYNTVQIGCKTISKQEIINMRDFMKGKFKTISLEGNEVSLETIEKILAKLK